MWAPWQLNAQWRQCVPPPTSSKCMHRLEHDRSVVALSAVDTAQERVRSHNYRCVVALSRGGRGVCLFSLSGHTLKPCRVRVRPAIPRRRNRPKPGRRRALELLASCRDGCTEAIMLAHGFTIEQMVELVNAGLAIANAERMVAGGKR